MRMEQRSQIRQVNMVSVKSNYLLRTIIQHGDQQPDRQGDSKEVRETCSALQPVRTQMKAAMTREKSRGPDISENGQQAL